MFTLQQFDFDDHGLKVENKMLFKLLLLYYYGDFLTLSNFEQPDISFKSKCMHWVDISQACKNLALKVHRYIFFFFKFFFFCSL